MTINNSHQAELVAGGVTLSTSLAAVWSEAAGMLSKIAITVVAGVLSGVMTKLLGKLFEKFDHKKDK